MYKILIVWMAISLMACNEHHPEEKKAGGDTEGSLVGEWNNVTLKVNTYSKANTDSNEVFDVEAGKWEEKVKIRPIRSFFRADSTWNSAHYTLKDSLFYNPSGKWWTDGDKLTMLQLLPSADTTVYTFSIKNDTVSFEAMLDWDMDGKKDDRYFGTQVRKSK